MNDTAIEQKMEAAAPGNEPESNRPAGVRPSFASSLFFIAGGQVATVAFAALTEFCIARLLGPAQQGRISLCLMSTVFGAVIGSIGSEATVVVWISQAKGERATWFPAVMFWVTSGSVLACVFWGLFYWRWHLAFLKGLTSESAVIVLVAIPVTVLFSILMSLLVGEERFRLRSIIALVNRASYLAIFLLCVVLLGRRSETALYGYLGGLAVGILMASTALWHFLRDIWKLGKARKSLIPTLVFGFRGQTGTLATFVSYRLDVFVVNYFLDATQVGLYALGVLVSEALWQLPGIVSTALCPRTARTIGAGADSFTCTVLRQVFLVTLVTGLVVALASPVALPLVFGKRFTPSIPVVWWIMPGTIMFSLGKVSGADLIGRGLNIYTPISSYLGMAITLILDWYLIPRMGIQGAALASSIAYFVAGGYLVIVLRRELKTSWRNLLVPTRNEFLAYKRVWLQIRERFKRREASTVAA